MNAQASVKKKHQTIASTWAQLRQWDLFPKFDSDIIVKSKAGGCVTVTAVIIVLILFMSETYYYFEEQRMDTIVVDTSRPMPLPIFFDIIFPFMDCNTANVDVVDDEEHPIPILSHNVKKYRITNKGTDLGVEKVKAQQQLSRGGIQTEPSKAGFGETTSICSDCGEVFNWKTGQICCTCQDVEQWSKNVAGTDQSYTAHSACIREHAKALIQSMGGETALVNSEGCRIRGKIVVPRARASLHVAAGIRQSWMGMETSSIKTLNDKFKVQHVIRQMQFGDDFEGQINPLEGHELYTPGLLRHIYLIKLVPTRYEGGWIPINSYQYTFAPHTEQVNTSVAHWHLPGVYFRYEFQPMMALLSTRYSHISTYITRLFALVGGLWVFLGVIYRLTNKVAETVTAKKNQ